jgi:hypothetical protein
MWIWRQQEAELVHEGAANVSGSQIGPIKHGTYLIGDARLTIGRSIRKR